jgi:hypothetical protein
MTRPRRHSICTISYCVEFAVIVQTRGWRNAEYSPIGSQIIDYSSSSYQYNSNLAEIKYVAGKIKFKNEGI